MRLPLDLSNGGWHMPKSLNFRHVNRYSEDRTSAVLPFKALRMQCLMRVKVDLFIQHPLRTPLLVPTPQ